MVTRLDILASSPSQGGEASFRIYPSLLDKFQSLLDYEDEAEQPWNIWHSAGLEKARAEAASQGKMASEALAGASRRGLFGHELDEYRQAAEFWEARQARLRSACEGDYVLTPEEMYERIEAELIAQVNRAPKEISEAADKGTALNEVIDCMLMRVRSTRDDVKCESLRLPDGSPYAIRALINGFCFDFDPALCFRLKEELAGSVCQKYLSTCIGTRYGTVELYGYSDYILLDRIIDLKTTSRYDFGKYERKWQRRVYPLCAVESGQCAEVSEFVYLVAKLGKGKIIGGELYAETYTYDHAKAQEETKAMVEDFIGWLTSPKILPQITDKRIFNQQD